MTAVWVQGLCDNVGGLVRELEQSDSSDSAIAVGLGFVLKSPIWISSFNIMITFIKKRK